MDETTQVWQDAGSGPGYMQTVFTTAKMREDQAYRALLGHCTGCEPCREAGVDCAEARALRAAWREAKAGTV